MSPLLLCEAGIREDAAKVCGYTLVSAFLLGTPVARGLFPGRRCQGVLTEYHVLFVLATDGDGVREYILSLYLINI